MGKTVEIENIEEMRRSAGIDDAELRADIRGLRVGDSVRLTLLNAARPSAGEMVRVRITRIRGSCFRGRRAGRSGRAGACLDFTAAHIHSVLKGRRTQGE